MNNFFLSVFLSISKLFHIFAENNVGHISLPLNIWTQTKQPDFLYGPNF